MRPLEFIPDGFGTSFHSKSVEENLVPPPGPKNLLEKGMDRTLLNLISILRTRRAEKSSENMAEGIPSLDVSSQPFL